MDIAAFLTVILCFVSIWFLIPMACLIVISSFSDITEKILLAWQPNRHYSIVLPKKQSPIHEITAKGLNLSLIKANDTFRCIPLAEYCQASR